MRKVKEKRGVWLVTRRGEKKGRSSKESVQVHKILVTFLMESEFVAMAYLKESF